MFRMIPARIPHVSVHKLAVFSADSSLQDSFCRTAYPTHDFVSAGSGLQKKLPILCRNFLLGIPNVVEYCTFSFYYCTTKTNVFFPIQKRECVDSDLNE